MRPTSSRGELITRISRRCRQPSTMAQTSFARGLPLLACRRGQSFETISSSLPASPMRRRISVSLRFSMGETEHRYSHVPIGLPPRASACSPVSWATRTGTCPASWLGPRHATDVPLSRSWVSSGKLMKSALFASAASTRASASPSPFQSRPARVYCCTQERS
jgi:hypothetical protein